MHFTVAKMFVLPDAGSLAAFADIAIDDCIVIRGVRIMRGRRGLFVQMPREQGKDNQWYDQIIIKDLAVQQAFERAVISRFQSETGCLTGIDLAQQPTTAWRTGENGVRI